MSDNFFCPLPWNHLFFKPNGKVQACCETYDTQFDPSETIEATANDPILKKLRLDLLNPKVKLSSLINYISLRITTIKLLQNAKYIEDTIKGKNK